MSNGKTYFNQWNDKNTLFTIYLGSNDIYIVNQVNKDNNPDIADYVKNNKSVSENLNNITNIIFDKIEEIYKIGGKNFMLVYIPPFDKAPLNTNKKYNFYKAQVPYFNSLLKEKSENLFKNYNDINIILYNNYAEYKYIIRKYNKYNFISGKKGWKIDSKDKNIIQKYFWADHTHITNKGNVIIAEDIDNLLKFISDKE